MLWHYAKAQLWVLLCGGLVGPIFLAVYFATGQSGLLKWMFYVGLLITAADILIALAIAPAGPGPAPPPAAPPPAQYMAPPEPSTSQRLQELETLRATGAVSEEEYNTKRAQILSEL
jgi:Short C-terminal domain